MDIDSLLVSQPDTGEQALEITEALVRSGAIDCIVIDSVAAMVPRAEIEGLMGDSHVGLQARLMSQALRKLTGVISKSNCAAVFINQLREKVGVVYGNPETTPGGRALKFYSSVRIEIRRGEQLKNGTEVIGNRTRAKVVKNMDIVNKSGAWFSYKEERLGQGRDNVKQLFKDRPELCEEIARQILDDGERLAEVTKKGKKVRGKKPAGKANIDIEVDEEPAAPGPAGKA